MEQFTKKVYIIEYSESFILYLDCYNAQNMIILGIMNNICCSLVLLTKELKSLRVHDMTKQKTATIVFNL